MADKKKSLWRKYKDSGTGKVIDNIMLYSTLMELLSQSTPMMKEGGQIKKKKKIKKKPRGWGKARYGK